MQNKDSLEWRITKILGEARKNRADDKTLTTILTDFVLFEQREAFREGEEQGRKRNRKAQRIGKTIIEESEDDGLFSGEGDH